MNDQLHSLKTQHKMKSDRLAALARTKGGDRMGDPDMLLLR